MLSATDILLAAILPTNEIILLGGKTPHFFSLSYSKTGKEVKLLKLIDLGKIEGTSFSWRIHPIPYLDHVFFFDDSKTLFIYYFLERLWKKQSLATT